MINNPQRAANPQNWGGANVVIDGDFPTAPIEMVPETTEIPIYLGKPMLPPPVGVARYDTRRNWAPVRNAGFAWGGALACLVPLAYAISNLLGGAGA